jgi:hypothetical protein
VRDRKSNNKTRMVSQSQQGSREHTCHPNLKKLTGRLTATSFARVPQSRPFTLQNSFRWAIFSLNFCPAIWLAWKILDHCECNAAQYLVAQYLHPRKCSVQTYSPGNRTPHEA